MNLVCQLKNKGWSLYKTSLLREKKSFQMDVDESVWNIIKEVHQRKNKSAFWGCSAPNRKPRWLSRFSLLLYHTPHFCDWFSFWEGEGWHLVAHPTWKRGVMKSSSYYSNVSFTGFHTQKSHEGDSTEVSTCAGQPLWAHLGGIRKKLCALSVSCSISTNQCAEFPA